MNLINASAPPKASYLKSQVKEVGGLSGGVKKPIPSLMDTDIQQRIKLHLGLLAMTSAWLLVSLLSSLPSPDTSSPLVTGVPSALDTTNPPARGVASTKNQVPVNRVRRMTQVVQWNCETDAPIEVATPYIQIEWSLNCQNNSGTQLTELKHRETNIELSWFATQPAISEHIALVSGDNHFDWQDPVAGKSMSIVVHRR